MMVLAYILIALVVWRLAAGHLAYSLTMTEEGKKRWARGPSFPLSRQDGSEPPMWFGGIWRGLIVGATWPVVPLWLLLASSMPKKTIVRLAVGNERRGRRLQEQREREEKTRRIEQEIDLG